MSANTVAVGVSHIAGRLRVLKRLSLLMMSLTASLSSLNHGSLRPSENSVKVLFRLARRLRANRCPLREA